MSDRKLFSITDPNGSFIALEGVERKDVIIDSFDVSRESYSLITTAFLGSSDTFYQAVHVKDNTGQQHGGMINGQFQRGSVRNVEITITGEDEINDAYCWLHNKSATDKHPAWKIVEKNREFIAKVKDWKRDFNNHAVLDQHRKKLRAYLEERKDKAVVEMIDAIQSVTIMNRNKSMEENKIPSKYLNEN